jgi:hypothetical protein
LDTGNLVHEIHHDLDKSCLDSFETWRDQMVDI